MRILLSILAFILSLVVVKIALAFLMVALGVTHIEGGGQLLINIVAYGLAFVAARALYKRLPNGKPKEPVRYATKAEVNEHFPAPSRVNKTQPWLTE